ncbi:MAG TPA: dihydrolipoamide acetyltransferase family protein [Candidatus Dormibacteraeota bacterium]|nr:dihydrolipoamide acetyltransferase family protein [Candidatus Dormibacteraeota bacterium]
MHREVLMPRLAEEAEEGVVVTWFVEPGAPVSEGDLLAELQVAKVSSEMHSPFSGRVVQLLVEPGGVARQGIPIAVIEEGEAAAPSVRSVPEAVTAAAEKLPAAGPAPASPSARRLARELGVDLAGFTGSGPGGRIVEADVQAAAARKAGGERKAVATGGPRIEPLTPMRRAIAERLTTWLGSTAQLTLTAEADLTALAEELERLGSGSGRRASYLEAVVRALALALRNHPAVGARWTDNGLAYSDRCDIGVAVALADGLIAPVVRDADRKDLATLGGEIAELAERARAGSLKPTEVEGGALSVTNLGAYRIDAFTPLLHPPQTAILGMGRARSRPAVIGGEIVPRLLMVLSLTFDHRVVDGAPAAAFLTEVVGLLEEPAALLRPVL